MTQLKLFSIGYRLAYPLYFSGADIFNFYLAKALNKAGHDCRFYHAYIPELEDSIKKQLADLNCDFQLNEMGFSFVYEGVSISLFHKDHFYNEVKRHVNANKDAILWHQQPTIEGFDLSHIFNEDFKNICYIRSIDSLNYFQNYHSNMQSIFANSQFCKNEIKKVYQKESTVIFPLPKESCISLKKRKDGDFITFINPAKVKGLDIVEQLIKDNPKRKFMIVYAWSSKLPARFGDYKNLVVLPSQHDVSEIYNYSRLVLIPSQWQEFFGRVQFEAAWNNVPVCVSNTGAAKEFFADNGVLVDDYKSVNAWQAAIEALDNHDTYSSAVKNCSLLKKNYDFKSEVDKFEAALLMR